MALPRLYWVGAGLRTDLGWRSTIAGRRGDLRSAANGRDAVAPLPVAECLPSGGEAYARGLEHSPRGNTVLWWLFFSGSFLIANTRTTMSTRVFLPVGMLDLVPRLHSPPRVTIRGGFFLGGNRLSRMRWSVNLVSLWIF